MRKVMLLIPALLLVGLSGCGENISSNNNGESISTSDSASTNKEWSNEIKDLMNEYLKGVLPYHQFDETTFKYEIDAENGIIVLYDELLTNHISGYKDVLISNGWSLDEEMEVMAYSSYDEDEEGNLTNITGEFTFQEAVFSNENNGITVTYSFSDNDGIYDGGDGYYYEINKGNQLVAYLDSSSKGELTAWPADLIASYFNGAVVPAVNGIEQYYVDDSNMEEYGLTISFESNDENLEASYKQTLLDANFTIEYDEEWNGDLAVDADNKVVVGYYLADDGYFYIQIFDNSSDSGEVLTSWPSDNIKAIFNVDVPSFSATTYSVLDYSLLGAGYFIYCNDVDSNAEEEYKAILEENQYTVTYSKEDGYSAVDKDKLVDVYFALDGTSLIIIINSHVELVAWPADLIASYFNGAVVPAVNGVEKYFVDDSEMETYGLVISVESDDETIVDTYKQTLIDNEFIVNYDNSQEWYVAVDKDKLVDVAFYFGINEFTIQIFAHEEIAENVLDFSSETLITDSNSDKAVWENGNYKMIVTKATSASNVGNGTYLSNPLRLYVGQHVELSWGEESVSTIEINLASANNKSSLSTISSLTGGSISINENVAIITVSEGASKVEFDIVKNGDFKQCHISSIVFNA